MSELTNDDFNEIMSEMNLHYEDCCFLINSGLNNKIICAKYTTSYQPAITPNYFIDCLFYSKDLRIIFEKDMNNKYFLTIYGDDLIVDLTYKLFRRYANGEMLRRFGKSIFCFYEY